MLAWHPYEPSTYANPQDFITKHLHLDWTVDFEKQIIDGYIDLTMQVTPKETMQVILAQIESKANIEQWASGNHSEDKEIEMLYNAISDEMDDDAKLARLHLDTRDLEIAKVVILPLNKDESKGLPVKFSLANRHFSYGQKLTVEMDPIFNVDSFAESNNVRKTIVKKFSSKGAFSVIEPFVVRIHYATRPECGAAQWLPPSQTADGIHSYLFTQCQSIFARSLFPCQDNPGLKTTYTSKIRVPEGYTGLMSAVEKTPPRNEAFNGKTYSVSEWEQKVPISTYLIVIVVGHLASRDLSPRCRIWSEPEMIEKCAWEFAEVDSFITAAEGVCGSAYSPTWGRYDMLVLPFSFAYGGMENVCLTFVTSSLICGDRSLVDVVYHEIAHSWTGNLVTNHSWYALWLNESFTMMAERKITKAIQGQKMHDLSQLIGWESLRSTVEELGVDNPMTALHPVLDHRDPDDGFNLIPYEKGYFILCHIENLVGGPEVFDKYFRAHIANFAFKAITEIDWIKFMFAYFGNPANGAPCGPELEQKLRNLDWHALMLGTGMPPVDIPFGRELAQQADDLATAWIDADAAGKVPDQALLNKDTFQSMSCLQKQRFLDDLSVNPKGLRRETIAELDKAYDMTPVKNAEIRYRWQVLAIRSGASDLIKPDIAEFMAGVGRINYLRPVYGELLKRGGADAQLAAEIYKPMKPKYQGMAQTALDSIFAGKDDESKDDSAEKKEHPDAVLKRGLAFDCKSAALTWFLSQKTKDQTKH